MNVATARRARLDAMIAGWIADGTVTVRTFSRGPKHYQYTCPSCQRGICAVGIWYTQGKPMCAGCAGHISGGAPMSAEDWARWLDWRRELYQPRGAA